MVNSHKLMVMVLSINLMIGLITTMYQDPKNFSDENIKNQIELSEQYAQETERKGLTAWVQAKWQEFENTVGSTFGWGLDILKIFLQSLNPFPFGFGSSENPIEVLFIYGLMIFKAFTYYIVGLELYMITKNKKAS